MTSSFAKLPCQETAQGPLQMVMLQKTFQGMWARRKSAATQPSGHTPRSGPEIEDKEKSKITLQKVQRQDTREDD